MSAPDELYPPVQYEGWWLLIALGILVAVAGIAWLAWALTRPPRARPDPPVPLGAQLDALRAHHLDRIARVEQAVSAGAMSDRDANAELSRITRAFVNEFTGVETPVLTLDGLEARGASPDLVAAVRHHYYPSVYGTEAATDPAVSIAAARQVVTGWH